MADGPEKTKEVTTYKKIAPAIKKLELTAATMAVSMAEKAAKLLEIPLSEVVFWTDSENVKHQLNNGGTGNFITATNAKKIEHILAQTSPIQWWHVDGKLNPADVASRGVTSAENFIKHDLWFHGPNFIQENPENWPEQNLISPFRRNEEMHYCSWPTSNRKSLENC